MTGSFRCTSFALCLRFRPLHPHSKNHFVVIPVSPKAKAGTQNPKHFNQLTWIAVFAVCGHETGMTPN